MTNPLLKWTMLIVLCSVTLAGCCTPKIVYVPVESCPPPKDEIVYPVLQTENLPSDASTKQRLEALRLDFNSLQTELKRCIIVLDAYKN